MPSARLQKLLSLASPALVPSTEPAMTTADSPLHFALAELLNERNGFYAFENALHLYADAEGPGTLRHQNAPQTWRSEYGNLADGLLFFAQDVFGNQFALADTGVVFFDAETGETQHMAADLEGWADAVLGDFKYWTGWPLAHQWQAANGPMQAYQRLAPKMPFVLGGEYTLDNLYAAMTVEVMRFRGDLALQLRDLSDGAQIQLRIM